MRIAYLSSAMVPSPSANSLQVMKMCQAFVQEGHAVHLVLPPAEREAAGAADAPAPALLARQYGLRVSFPIRRVKLLPLLGRRGLAWAEADEAARIAPDLVYTRGLDIAWAVAQHGFPVLLEIHQPPAGRLGPLYFRQVLGRQNLRLAAISTALEEHLRRTFPDLRRSEILVAPDAADGEAYRRLPEPSAARKRLHLPPQPFTAGYFGSLAAGRGVELIGELAQRRPETAFLISGGGPDETWAWRARFPAGNIRWLGFLPNADVPLYQAACDALLMPYQREVTLNGRGNTAETMSPLKMFEYMAAGRPILSSDLPALRSMLNEENSVLLRPDDPAAWADALDRLRRNPRQRKRLAVRARADVRPHTWRNRARRILEFAAARHG